MKYRLKDRELQQKLDELSDGDFSKQLARLPCHALQQIDP